MKRGTVRLSLTMVWLFTGLCLSPESHAAVEVLPEVSMTVDGLAITDPAAIAMQPVVQELLAAFGRAESAVQRQDLDALLKFYAEAYNYPGLKRADVRRIWGEVFEHYTGLSSTHLFSDMKVLRSGAQLRAEVTCTGGLYGAERKGGQRITLDSWFREGHFLVHERDLVSPRGKPTDLIAPWTALPTHRDHPLGAASRPRFGVAPRETDRPDRAVDGAPTHARERGHRVGAASRPRSESRRGRRSYRPTARRRDPVM